ncbi:peptidoglycan -binding protein [Primorskyibacter sp. S87]|uniref:peptidoglycan -binding protein n=1 Tax=Primorskyibacter sp. S87 TaxID=3415126 RepID=UPI003C7E0E4C
MALSRRTGQRFQGSIWPGFVDAMTGLLLVLMFVLTIFMVVQFVLRETISGQESELDALSAEVSALASALGLEERKSNQLEARLGALNATLNTTEGDLERVRAELASQTQALDSANTRITDFEAQVAALIADRDKALVDIATLEEARAGLEAERTELLSAQDALHLALAQSRSEIDAQTEAARLAAAQREALEAMVSDLQARQTEAEQARAELAERLSDEEAARLAEAAAAEALRARLQDADAELTAMTLALEAQRKDAEDTLTLLAAADAARAALDEKLGGVLADLEQVRAEASTSQSELEAAQAQAAADALDREELQRRLLAALGSQDDAETRIAEQATLAEQRAALLAQAKAALADQEEISLEAQRETALLNQQVAALRTQLGGLQALLDDFKERDAAAQIQLQNLGQDLNAALARAASEERKRRILEEAERKRLEEEALALEAEARELEAQAKDLERYRSEFFGRLRDLLGNQEGVRIEGDRFVFSSEVLFPPAEAELSIEGQIEVGKVASILRNVAEEIPPEINWVIRVDGHTDNIPLSGTGRYRDNWELSQGRALSVVRYMVNGLGIPPERLAANGFGEFQPINTDDTPEARAQNRRIELKLTEK